MIINTYIASVLKSCETVVLTKLVYLHFFGNNISRVKI